jgi:phosphatidylserine/phosphatidylglycerophosphate/cardiolipin synthase-like enzyme
LKAEGNRKGQILFRLIVIGWLLLISGCREQPAVWLEPLPSATPAGNTSPDQLVSVFFTAPSSDSFSGGPDRQLVAALDQARSQVDAALYDLDLWSIRNALIRAHQRGVQVRMVVEEDSLYRPEIQELIEAGIPVIADGPDGLMHNKFLIIDGAEVWTGSMNLTINGAYRNLNNLVRVRSFLLAENFTTEFEEMFLEGFFGQLVLENTPHPDLTIDGVRIETFFSPDDSTAARIIQLILDAEESIDFMYYSFTSDGIADALLYQANQGIQVRGVLDAYQEEAGEGSEYQRLRRAGLDVFLDRHPEKMHHKVLVIDHSIVVTGSYNLTRSAETQNDENTLVIYDQGVAGLFENEFDWIFQQAAGR